MESSPFPFSGDYPLGPQEDIDDSLYVYSKHGPQPQSPSPTVSNASSIVFSICPSNDSVWGDWLLCLLQVPLFTQLQMQSILLALPSTVPLGKFDGKSDEGFLVGYSVNSKAFRGIGHRWMFDLDYLTDSNELYTGLLCKIKPNPADSLPKQPSLHQYPKSDDDIMALEKELDALALKCIRTSLMQMMMRCIEIRIYDKSSEGSMTRLLLLMLGSITDLTILPDEVDVTTNPTLRIHNAHPQDSNEVQWVKPYMFLQALQVKLEQGGNLHISRHVYSQQDFSSIAVIEDFQVSHGLTKEDCWEIHNRWLSISWSKTYLMECQETDLLKPLQQLEADILTLQYLLGVGKGIMHRGSIGHGNRHASCSLAIGCKLVTGGLKNLDSGRKSQCDPQDSSGSIEKEEGYKRKKRDQKVRKCLIAWTFKIMILLEKEVNTMYVKLILQYLNYAAREEVNTACEDNNGSIKLNTVIVQDQYCWMKIKVKEKERSMLSEEIQRTKLEAKYRVNKEHAWGEIPKVKTLQSRWWIFGESKKKLFAEENQGTWKMTQLKKLSFEEVKEEFDKLVKNTLNLLLNKFEATKASKFCRDVSGMEEESRWLENGLIKMLIENDSEDTDKVDKQRRGLNTDDLTELYRIVMNRYGVDGPEDKLEKGFWKCLRIMFEEPLSTDSIWSAKGLHKPCASGYQLDHGHTPFLGGQELTTLELNGLTGKETSNHLNFH
ncbi:hypothetical protein Tco_0578615 [Tanacetum coccineum]